MTTTYNEEPVWCVTYPRGRGYRYCLLPGTGVRNRIIVPYFEGAELLSQEELAEACEYEYCRRKILGDTQIELISWDGKNSFETDME